MTAIKFYVPGTPSPQGSKRHVGRGIMVESSAGLTAWRQRIAIAAHNAKLLQAPDEPLFDGPAALFIEFVLPRPKRPATPAAIQRPDLDKLARAVFDAVTGTLLRDDAQIIELNATKRRALAAEAPGAHVELIDLAETLDALDAWNPRNKHGGKTLPGLPPETTAEART